MRFIALTVCSPVRNSSGIPVRRSSSGANGSSKSASKWRSTLGMRAVIASCRSGAR